MVGKHSQSTGEIVQGGMSLDRCSASSHIWVLFKAEGSISFTNPHKVLGDAPAIALCFRLMSCTQNP